MSWYIEKGPNSDVVISSRIRLARNLDNHPFPNRLDNPESKKVASGILDTFKKHSGFQKDKYMVLRMEDLGNEEKQSLVEKHLISEELTDTRIDRYAVIRSDESVSVMVNEEDHIRIQSLKSGFDLENAYETAQGIACFFEKKLKIAYSEKFGFLTACPSNTGTALRASVIMHIPGMVLTKKASSLIEKIQKMGYSVRGYYGEHSNPLGNMFQISNQITLGLNEDELISDLKKLINQIIEKERQVRKDVYEKNPGYLEDMVFRSLGILKHARIITTEEALKMISDVRLGKSLGIINEVSEKDINKIMNIIGPASVQKAAGRIMKSDERDKTRAGVIRTQLKDGEKK